MCRRNTRQEASKSKNKKLSLNVRKGSISKSKGQKKSKELMDKAAKDKVAKEKAAKDKEARLARVKELKEKEAKAQEAAETKEETDLLARGEGTEEEEGNRYLFNLLIGILFDELSLYVARFW